MSSRSWTSLIGLLVAICSLHATSAWAGAAEDIEKNWKPDCEAEGGRTMVVQVAFTVGPNGDIVGEVTPRIRGAKTPVSEAAAAQAVRAVRASAPFRDLPREFSGKKIIVQLNASEACS